LTGATTTAISVLTPVRDRVDHLAGLVDGLNRAVVGADFELVIGRMGGEDPSAALRRARGFEARAIPIAGDELPLSSARNQLAAAAAGALLVYLDVDCVPSPGLLAAYATALTAHDALALGETRYLPKGFRADGASEMALRRAALPHPERINLFPAPGVTRLDRRHELFWSLNFAIRRITFERRIGGFDENYRGYGIEDTDFAMRAARAEVPITWVGGAVAFHQHHPPTRLDPDRVAALVANARRYREHWGTWPATGWLAELAGLGMVEWDEATDTLAVADMLEPATSSIR
jgi:GT2 family glycosyltransferase